MTLLFNVGIDIFAATITVIIYYSYKNDFGNTYDNWLMVRIEGAVLLAILADIAMWVLNGKSGTGVRGASYAVSMIYFMMQLLVGLAWLKYAWYRVFGENMSRKGELLSRGIPLFLLGVCIAFTPLTGWCFYLDEYNYYHRGALSTPMFVFILAYLLTASAMALARYRQEVFVDRKKELLSIAFFAVPPLVGGVIQVAIYGVSLVWPSMVISCLMILLNKESRTISQDSLTGLNNRRSMEKYLRGYGEGGQAGAIALLMMDINDFKQINDQYGHHTGDAALIQTANILRRTFNGTSAFLARFGGDEFVVFLAGAKASEVDETVRKIRDHFAAFNQTGQFPFGLTVSIGYAVSEGKAPNRIANLIKQADENMYREKTRYHQRKP